MKKNLKIVSAAAAALLAVAPVAASAIPVGAANTIRVNVNNGDNTNQNSTDNIELNLSVSNSDNVIPGTEPSSLPVTLSANIGTPKINGKVQAYDVTNQHNTDGEYDIKSLKNPVSKLQAGKKYIIVAKNVTLSGLNSNTEYTFNNKTVTTDTYGNLVPGVDIQSSAFTVLSSASGTPYFSYNGEVAGSGNITLNNNSAQNILDVFKQKYKPANTVKSTRSWVATNLSSIKSQLKDHNIKVNNDKSGTFSAPANDFTIQFTVRAENGETSFLTVTVHPKAEVNTTSPIFVYQGTTYHNGQTIDARNDSALRIPLNGNVDTNAISEAITAHVNTNNTDNVPYAINTDKVNTEVNGEYPITLSVTNPAHKTAKVTLEVQVGDPDASTQTVKTTTPVVTINGNSVSKTSTSVKSGDRVSVYGTTEVNHITYYRLNSVSSNEFVAASAFTGKTSKPTKHTTKNKYKRLRLKKNAYIYNQNHKRIGKTVYKKGSAHNLVTNNKGAVYHFFNKFTAYQLADGRYKNDYIDVRNFGVKVSTPKKTRRTKTTYKKARVRSRVFYANGKAVRRYYIGKNTNIRVYGTKRIHGQNYYVIGKGRYVKTSNFR